MTISSNETFEVIATTEIDGNICTSASQATLRFRCDGFLILDTLGEAGSRVLYVFDPELEKSCNQPAQQ